VLFLPSPQMFEALSLLEQVEVVVEALQEQAGVEVLEELSLLERGTEQGKIPELFGIFSWRLCSH